MEEATKLVSLNDLITLNNLVLVIAIQVCLGAIKSTLDKLKLLKKLLVEILLPYMPMLLGIGTAFIPGVIDAANLGTRIIFGLAIGGISGQIWKAVWKNSDDFLKGKLGEKSE